MINNLITKLSTSKKPHPQSDSSLTASLHQNTFGATQILKTVTLRFSSLARGIPAGDNTALFALFFPSVLQRGEIHLIQSAGPFFPGSVLNDALWHQFFSPILILLHRPAQRRRKRVRFSPFTRSKKSSSEAAERQPSP